MNPIEKPDFLPFENPPKNKEQCIEAMAYLLRLEIEKGSPLSSNEIYCELTGERFGIGASLRQREILDDVTRKIADFIPRYITYTPEKIISDLERA